MSLLDYTKFLCTFFILLILLIYAVIDFIPVVAMENATDYIFVKEQGSKGTSIDQFLRPHDLEFDNQNKYLFVVDRDGNFIQVFDKNGTFLSKFGEKGEW